MKKTEEIIKAFRERFPNAHLVKSWTMEECDSNVEKSPFCTCQEDIEAFLTQAITDIQREMVEKCEELITDRSSKTYTPSPFTKPTADQIEFMGYVSGITDVIKILQSPAKEEECNCCKWDDMGYQHEPHCNLFTNSKS